MAHTAPESAPSSSAAFIGPAAGPSLQQEDSTEENCECPFCCGSFCQDGEEWVRCACSRWVHKQCVEEIFRDVNGEERFCPFCLN